MDLSIVRHGIALDVGEEGIQSDFERKLSPKGIEKTGIIAKAFKKMEVNPGLILTSPLVRARETAAIIAEELKIQKNIKESDHLRPNADLHTCIQMLSNQKERSIMVVGHIPCLPMLASLLLTKNFGTHIVLKKAGICGISFEEKIQEGTGLLRMLLEPKQLVLMTE